MVMSCTSPVTWTHSHLESGVAVTHGPSPAAADWPVVQSNIFGRSTPSRSALGFGDDNIRLTRPKMLAPSRSRTLERAVPSVASLPSFLVPALQSRRTFSSTTAKSSKLGRTPISIPPGVELLVGPPTTKKDPTTWKQMPKRTVTVTGPLGQLYLDIPPYVKIDQDEAAKRAMLSVEDTTEKHQREMWGALFPFTPREDMQVDADGR